MSDKITKQTIENLTSVIDDLSHNINSLTIALEKTDDFNNWTYADSLASIANSLVKKNSIENKKKLTRGEVEQILKNL